jgi:hypothetical protein
MKMIALLGAAAGGLLLLVSPDEASLTHQKEKKGAPAIVHRTPAIGGAVVHPVIVKPPPAKVIRPVVINKTPVIVAPKIPVKIVEPIKPIVKEPVGVFVNKNVGKFVGPAEKVPVGPAVVHRPVILDKPAVHVVTAYQKKLGNAPIKVGGKAVAVNYRGDLVTRFNQNWQQRYDNRFHRADLIRADLGHKWDHLFAPHWFDAYHGVHAGWWGRWPGFAATWYDAFTLRHHWGWWHPVGWDAFTAWCFPAVWGPPLYYDYGGNVIFDNSVVYVEGTPVASAADYATQALALAASGADWLAANPPDPNAIDQQWLPMGVWGLTNQAQGDPSMFVQLAVNKGGVIVGTYSNSLTNDALPVVGAIDPNTQRAAWYIGDNKDTVFDTGAYNLSLSESQVLVHFGLDKQQTWLMVRMPDPGQ